MDSQKKLSYAFIILFTISTFFPIVASVVNRKGISIFAGISDVGIALGCFVLYALLTVKIKKVDGAEGKSRKIMQYAAASPLILICIFFIGVDIRWDILLLGLGWRFWLLIMAIPLLVAGVGPGNRQ